MASLNIDELLQEVSSAAPCGENLEYDPEYGALERAIQGRPEQQFGDTIVEGSDPEWRDVQRHALSLFARTKDLRVAAFLTQSLVHLHGWNGFQDGLSIVHGLLERYWEHVHPQLDPEDDNDPVPRINAIIDLCHPESTLKTLRLAPLVSSRSLGFFSLRDVQVATKELTVAPDSQATAPELQTIEAAVQSIDIDTLQAMAAVIDDCWTLLTGIEARLLDYVGSGSAPDLSETQAVIKAAKKTLITWIAARTGFPPNNSDSFESSTIDIALSANTDSVQLTSINQTAGLVTITNRNDVVRALDLLCEYYKRQEPSSPLPLLLQRAKRLVNKDFLEILQDIAPDGLMQAEMIRGPEPDESA